ncbi:MAG: AAA ATPase, central domain protein [SAR86 cluster bacterium SAR86B]|uniref:AAA ATPase, central domain protein n=1 Tax=SAR86 cluster bacterium SAR86B TaxID=1123867 RepID=J4X0C8_9GAMM|nr:MAG: AAA ATPase, central domain protein [SAR86 cluster bacterium SAR86B]
MRTTTDSYYNKYNNPSYHGIRNIDNPLIISPSSKIKDGLFNREREMLEKSLTPAIEKKKVTIEVEIETIDDILRLIEEYPIQYDIEYNINMQSLHNIKEPLIKLNNMIGMKSLKTNILDQILYFVQDLHKNEETVETNILDTFGRIIGRTKKKVNRGGDFMHTCIYGPPGTGKTEVAKIMGSIFSKLGVLKKNVFKKVTRADLIAGYLGQTAMKTRDAVKDCLGGVMFIDEAYALGNVEKRDSFAKECIDTLCEALSDHKDELMVIIAGYEKELNKCFFSYNQGLDSRFTWRFKTDDYSPDELRQIFIKKVKEMGWKVEDGNVNTEWFEKNKDFFKFYGRDMENLFSKVKIAHSRRVFCLPPEKKKTINDKDLEKGLNMFLSNEDVKKRKEDKEKYEQLYYKMYT